MARFLKNKASILFLFTSLFISPSSFAASSAQDGMFAGLSLGYQTISGTQTYSGVSYGLLIGKDFAMGSKLGIKAYFSLHTAMLSPSSSITSPALGLGLNLGSLSGVVVTSYDVSANGSTLDKNLGLKGEVLYSLFKGKSFQFQLGGDFGAAVFLLKSSTVMDVIMRFVWAID